MGAWFYVEPRMRTVLRKIGSSEPGLQYLTYKDVEYVKEKIVKTVYIPKYCGTVVTG